MKKMTKWLAVCAVCVMGSVPAMAAEVPDVTVTPIPIETPAPDVTPIETPAPTHSASFMRRRSITYFIDRFHRRIYSSIKSDRVICAGNIKIDRSRNADRIYAEVRKFLSSGKRTVSSDNYKSVDTVFFTDCSRFLLSFFRTHRFTTRCLKERTSALDLLRHIAR